MLSTLDFKELRTPADHGDVLIQPAPDRLMQLAEANRRLLEKNDFPALGVPASECRRTARRCFCPGRADALWIVTGHQPEFIHPGVWAKHVVTQRLADALGGVAANLIVDHDAVKKPALSVPAERDGRLQIVEVPLAPYRPGWPWELLEPLTSEQLSDFAQRVRAACGPRYDASLMNTFIEAARAVRQPTDWVDQTVAGRRAIDAIFGVDMLESRAGAVWTGPFVAEMLVNAERFFDCYNAALGAYRRQMGIKGNTRPIPDLLRGDDRLELPIWAIRPSMPRQRLFVSAQADRIDLYAEQDPIGSVGRSDLQDPDALPEVLRDAISAALRPRALTLTMWARLFLGDLFVHGIGGAKYDRMTDLLIRSYFGVEPPGFCCVSATLRLDLPRRPVDLSYLHAAQHRLRDVGYNPQRYLPRTPELETLLAAKTEQVAQSAHLRATRPDDRSARWQVFERIRRLNEQMLSFDSTIQARFAAERERIGRDLADNAVADSREYFIGLFRRADLALLCEALPRFD